MRASISDTKSFGRKSSTIQFGLPILFMIALSVLVTTVGLADETDSKHEEGLRTNTPGKFLLQGATVYITPTKKLENASILIDGRKIIEVKKKINAPAGTQIIDMTGKHIYAGFIEPFVPYSVTLESNVGTAYWNENVRPQISVAEHFDFNEIKTKELRESGFTSALVAPASGIIKGQSSIMMLSGENREHALLAPDVAQHMRLTVSRGSRTPGAPRTQRPQYPNSPMGAFALARQAFYDAQWYTKAWKVAEKNAELERPETNISLASLNAAATGKQPVVIDTSNELFALRADRFAKEFDLDLIIKGSGNEYRRLEEIAELKRPIILPIDFPLAPDVSSPELGLETTLETLMHWDIAPENPARVAKSGIVFAITSNGLKKKANFLDNLRKAVSRGLEKETALAAITTVPAEMFKVDKLVGTIAKGKYANLTILDDDMFEKKAKVAETWIAGNRFEAKPAPIRNVNGTWTVKSESMGELIFEVTDEGGKVSAKIVLPKDAGGDEDDGAKDDDDKGAEEDDEKDAKNDKPKTKTIAVKPLSFAGSRLSGAFKSDDLGKEGVCQITLVVEEDGTALGTLVLPDGTNESVSASQTETSDDEKEDEKQADEKQKSDDESETVMASFDVNYPLGGYGVASIPEQPKTVLIKNATIWTCEKEGIIEKGSVLISKGKIKKVFEGDAKLPSADVVIDGDGMHVTPGIIDCHSHMASDSGINESGQAVTAEVRIGDYIDCDDINIYRQLAGGVTAVSILHGSSNPIGGQNQVIKLRWGAGDDAMKFKDAPAGIKFALGENVKRSNSNDRTRYPQTRMGVEQIIHDAFRAGGEYAKRHKEFVKSKKGLPPRIDLELEAMSEIIAGKRWIHCHSYRQDEILALIRLLDSYDVTIGTFQHILEGYKVADKMAEHDAMASAFADWWAYKYEVIDAIPFGGALMHRAGVVVSFNSDDSELARHLNHEAAKAVR